MFQDDSIVVAKIFEEHRGVLTRPLTLGLNGSMQFDAGCERCDGCLDSCMQLFASSQRRDSGLNRRVHFPPRGQRRNCHSQFLTCRKGWQNLLNKTEAPVHISDDVLERYFIHVANPRTIYAARSKASYHRPIARNDCARQDRGWFQRGAHASGCRARPTWAAATPTILVTGTYFTGGDPGR